MRTTARFFIATAALLAISYAYLPFAHAANNVTITVQTAPMAFPAGTAGGQWLIGVTDANGGAVTGVPSQTVDMPTATFALPDGTFIAHAQRLDSKGANLGPSIASAQFTTTSTNVLIDVPSILAHTCDAACAVK